MKRVISVLLSILCALVCPPALSTQAAPGDIVANPVFNVNTANPTTLIFGGREWIVIGFDNQIPNPVTNNGMEVTTPISSLMLLQKTYDNSDNTYFDNTTAKVNQYAGSTLQAKMQERVFEDLLPAEQAAVIPRMLTGGAGVYSYLNIPQTGVTPADTNLTVEGSSDSDTYAVHAFVDANTVFDWNAYHDERIAGSINPGTSVPYTGSYHPDNVAGPTIRSEIFWPLSLAEASLLNPALRDYERLWWLRSPGSLSTAAAAVNPDGQIGADGVYVSYVSTDVYAARPALMLDPSAVKFKDCGLNDTYVVDAGDVPPPPSSGLIPDPVFDINTDNPTTVIFNDREWWVIGYDGQIPQHGIRGMSGMQSIMLLQKTYEEGDGTFFAGTSLATNEYLNSNLYIKMYSRVLRDYTDGQRAAIIPRDLEGGSSEFTNSGDLSGVQRDMSNEQVARGCLANTYAAPAYVYSDATFDWFAYDDDRRTGTIGSRAYTGTYHPHNVAGPTVTGQLYWPLSVAEASLVNPYVRKYGRYWWLRSPGDSPTKAAYVSDNGVILGNGPDVPNEDAARPAFNLHLAAATFITTETEKSVVEGQIKVYSTYRSSLSLENYRDVLQTTTFATDNLQNYYVYDGTSSTIHNLQFNIENYIMADDSYPNEFDNMLKNYLFIGTATEPTYANIFATRVAQALQSGLNDALASRGIPVTMTITGNYRSDGIVELIVFGPSGAGISMSGCPALKNENFGHVYMHLRCEPDTTSEIKTGSVLKTYSSTFIVNAQGTGGNFPVIPNAPGGNVVQNPTFDINTNSPTTIIFGNREWLVIGANGVIPAGGVVGASKPSSLMLLQKNYTSADRTSFNLASPFSHEYLGSDLQTNLISRLNTDLTARERGVILPRTLVGGSDVLTSGGYLNMEKPLSFGQTAMGQSPTQWSRYVALSPSVTYDWITYHTQRLIGAAGTPYTGSFHPDRIAGLAAVDQLYWPLSFAEASLLNPEVRKYGGWWWLRSSGISDIRAAEVLEDGTVDGQGLYVRGSYAARPCLILDSDTVVFKSVGTVKQTGTINTYLVGFNNATPTPLPPGAFIYGDVNSDGFVSGMDVVRLAQYVAGYPMSLSPAEYTAADVNNDGAINGMDVVRLARYVAYGSPPEPQLGI